MVKLDYVSPNELMKSMVDGGKYKSLLPIKNIFIGGLLSGAILGFATTLALTAATDSGLEIIGAIIFPTGFVMILLLNLELVTGSFAVIPMAFFRKKTTLNLMLRNFSLAFIANLCGGLLYAILFSIVVTNFWDVSYSPLISKIISVAENKTTVYQEIGGRGIFVVFVKAMLCNWMVTMGVVMSYTSKSTIGKIGAMWLPVLIFFGQGFEHAVVNMSLIPLAILLSSDITIKQWWIWNQIPVTVGNFIGAFVFVALALHLITKKDSNKKVIIKK